MYRYSNKSKNEDKDWKDLVKLFQSPGDNLTLDELFGLFMTDREREVLLDRYRLVRALLSETQSQRSIGASLGLSISKITAGSKALQKLTKQKRNQLRQVLQ